MSMNHNFMEKVALNRFDKYIQEKVNDLRAHKNVSKKDLKRLNQTRLSQIVNPSSNAVSPAANNGKRIVRPREILTTKNGTTFRKIPTDHGEERVILKDSLVPIYSMQANSLAKSKGHGQPNRKSRLKTLAQLRANNEHMVNKRYHMGDMAGHPDSRAATVKSNLKQGKHQTIKGKWVEPAVASAVPDYEGYVAYATKPASVSQAQKANIIKRHPLAFGIPAAAAVAGGVGAGGYALYKHHKKKKQEEAEKAAAIADYEMEILASVY